MIGLLCSRNAHDRNVLVRYAHSLAHSSLCIARGCTRRVAMPFSTRTPRKPGASNTLTPTLAPCT